MENSDDNKLIANKLLAISLWFYQNLDREKIKDRYTIYNSIFILLMLYQCLISAISCSSVYYFWTNNTVEALFNLTVMINILFGNYKLYVVARYSKDIWNCLSITQFNFTKYDCQFRRILNLWRNRIIWVTYIFTVLIILYLICMATYPKAFNNKFVMIKNDDGSFRKYHLNIFNLYAIFSEEIYNTYFNVFYIIELSCLVILLLSIFIFDTILMTLCLTISCQLQIICNAYELIGHTTPHFPINSKCKFSTFLQLYWGVKFVSQFSISFFIEVCIIQ